MGFPWWVWVALILVAVIMLGSRSSGDWRRAIRGELIEFLKREAPEIEIVAQRERQLELRMGSEGELTVSLHNVLSQCARLKPDDVKGREAVFARLVAALREGESARATLDPGRDRQRILPRIVTDSMVRGLSEAIKGGELPVVGLGVRGLNVVPVLDMENSVSYLTTEDLAAIDLTAVEALEVAKENLARAFKPEVVRHVLEESAISVVQSLDSFDAARLLLVPGCLEEGERVVAMIPDRDTLVIAPEPGDGDWAPLYELARSATGDPLWKRPLLVSRDGISAVEGR